MVYDCRPKGCGPCTCDDGLCGNRLTPIPCKFCNGAPRVTPILVHYDTPRRTGPHSMSRVACECGAIGKCRPTPEAAIESWNEPWQAMVDGQPTAPLTIERLREFGNDPAAKEAIQPPSRFA